MSSSANASSHAYWIKGKFEVWKGHFLLAITLSFVWMIIAKNHYYYNHNFISFIGINLFPLVGWAVGLFIVHRLFIKLGTYFKKINYFANILLFSIIYWSLLIAAETIGYHFFNIKNLATASYPGLPMCDCLHAPVWMKIGYFAMGPIFFFICRFMNLGYSETNSDSIMDINVQVR